MISKEDPIDVVYTWCDGSDPKFIEEKRAAFKQSGLEYKEEDSGEVRYSDHDELRYSLRSVHQYLPWVRRIFIVTNKQRPKWLKEHEKITVVDHSEIIPHELLPTFSSVTIEMYLSKIPGLAEKFIYLNDDIFIARDMSPTDFFDGDKPVVRFSRKYNSRLTIDEAKEVIGERKDDFTSTLYRSWLLFCQRNKKKIPYEQLVHSVDSYTKTIFDETVKKYPELLSVNSGKFRTGKEYQRILFLYEMGYNLSCPIRRNRRFNFINRVRSYILPLEHFAIVRPSVRKMRRDLHVFKPQTFCLNSLPNEDAEDATKLLSELYGQKAPWEA